MRDSIKLDGLLFTNDGDVVSVMNRILGTFAIEAELCNDVNAAVETVGRRRLDAVIIDWGGAVDPSRIVRATRKSFPNSNSTIVAVVNRHSETKALMAGINFMVHKSTDTADATRCLRAAYGTMLQNRRRAARVPVNIAAVVVLGQSGEIEARIIDLSVSGLALQCALPLPPNRDILTRFSLPGRNNVIHAMGRVVNVNGTGRVGIRFSFLSDDDRSGLETWMAVELDKLETAEMPSDEDEVIID
jgi:hypothetical protein